MLVRPELGANVGSAMRAIANMGILTPLRIVGTPDILDEKSRALAKHASDRLGQTQFYADLSKALYIDEGDSLSLAATARIGSAKRPHPLWVRPAIEKALSKLSLEEKKNIFLVFGPEGDGLTNEEVDLCDWVVTIPSRPEYRSLNLAQAVLIFCYEVNFVLTEQWQRLESPKASQKQRLIQHMLQLAKESGFILPGDPHKMLPRLEEIFGQLPSHIKEARTLHGLIDQVMRQVVRSVQSGEVAYKGRFKNIASMATTSGKIRNPDPKSEMLTDVQEQV